MNYKNIPLIHKTQVGELDLRQSDILDLNLNENHKRDWDDAELLISPTFMYIPKGFSEMQINVTKINKGKYKIEPSMNINTNYCISQFDHEGVNYRHKDSLTGGNLLLSNNYLTELSIVIHSISQYTNPNQYKIEIYIDEMHFTSKELKDNYSTDAIYLTTHNINIPINKMVQSVNITLWYWLSPNADTGTGSWAVPASFSSTVYAQCLRKIIIPAKIDYIAIKK